MWPCCWLGSQRAEELGAEAPMQRLPVSANVSAWARKALVCVFDSRRPRSNQPRSSRSG